MMRKKAEEAINEPLELIISEKPFHVSSNHEGDCTCKFKADQYHIMAWRTPGNYNIGVDMYADNGHTSFLGCGSNNTVLTKDEGKKDLKIQSVPLKHEFILSGPPVVTTVGVSFLEDWAPRENRNPSLQRTASSFPSSLTASLPREKTGMSKNRPAFLFGFFACTRWLSTRIIELPIGISSSRRGCCGRRGGF